MEHFKNWKEGLHFLLQFRKQEIKDWIQDFTGKPATDSQIKRLTKTDKFYQDLKKELECEEILEGLYG